MSEVPLRYVIDASVGIKLFITEPLSEQAHALFGHLASEPPAEFFVPDLFYIECANILLKYHRRFGRRLEDALNDVVALGKIALRATPTSDLIEDALILAVRHNLTAYDACYVALAERLQIPLITADERLVRMVEQAQWLGDLAIPPLAPA